MSMGSEADLQVPGLSSWVGCGALHWGRAVRGAGGWVNLDCELLGGRDYRFLMSYFPF